MCYRCQHVTKDRNGELPGYLAQQCLRPVQQPCGSGRLCRRILEIGEQDVFIQILQVLETDEPTFLLGRDFLSRNEVVTFDWKGNRVRLEKTGFQSVVLQ